MPEHHADRFLYSWSETPSPLLGHVQIEDDSLRDGLQGAFVRKPSVPEKLELLELTAKMGIQGVMLGFPGSSRAEFEDCLALVHGVEERALQLTLRFLGRAQVRDMEPILELHRQSRRGVHADFFIGTSPLRRHVEQWNFTEMLREIDAVASFLNKSGIPFSISLEDATRTPPEDLQAAVTVVAKSGANCIAVCDTVGGAAPSGARRIVHFVRDSLVRSNAEIDVLWHGHNDQGMALANTIAAVEAGATIVGGSFLGIGERTGNVAMEQFILYLWQCGVRRYSLAPLRDYCHKIARYTGTPIADNAPLFGAQAFATCTGTHSSAILKARELGIDFEDYVFSAVPASQIGRGQDILIGPTSGQRNARYVLEQMGVQVSSECVEGLLNFAKTRDRWLRPHEISSWCSAQGIGSKQ